MSPSSPSRLRLRDRLRDEIAQAILAAAEEEFAAEGLHGARMERIASRAGVAVGTLYNHFEDRDALLCALAKSRRDMLVARIDTALASAPDRPIREQLRAYLSAVSEHARAHGRFLAALVAEGKGPARASPPAGLLQELVSRADAIVRRGIAAGELRDDEAQVFGLALVGMARAVLLRALERGAGWEGTTEAVVDLFLRGARR